jgi:uncharacterized surface protein with fasciclin (FAS1) repeats
MKLSRIFLHKTAAVAIVVAGVLVSNSTFAEIKANSASTMIAQTSGQINRAKKYTIATIVGHDGEFRTLKKALKAAGLLKTLSEKGPFTVFAPTDDAFKKLDQNTLKLLLKPENKDTLTKILNYHVLSGEVDSQDIQPGDVTTVEGSSLKIQVADGKVSLNDTTNVVKADVKAKNGVIHIIDQVLVPPDVDLTTLK